MAPGRDPTLDSVVDAAAIASATAVGFEDATSCASHHEARDASRGVRADKNACSINHSRLRNDSEGSDGQCSSEAIACTETLVPWNRCGGSQRSGKTRSIQAEVTHANLIRTLPFNCLGESQCESLRSWLVDRESTWACCSRRSLRATRSRRSRRSREKPPNRSHARAGREACSIGSLTFSRGCDGGGTQKRYGGRLLESKQHRDRERRESLSITTEIRLDTPCS